MVWEGQLLCLDIVVKFLVVRASEREFAAEERIEQDSQGPNISRRPRILNLAHDFGRHIRRSSTEDLDLTFMRDACRESKVNNLDSLPSLIQKNVLKLDVTVGHVPLMAVVDCLDNLSPEELGFQL